jgi:hypothetical protein
MKTVFTLHYKRNLHFGYLSGSGDSILSFDVGNAVVACCREMNTTVNWEDFGRSHLDSAQEEHPGTELKPFFMQLLAHVHNLTSRPAERTAGGGTREIRNE